MKNFAVSTALTIFTFLLTVQAYAQDGLDIDIDLGKAKWYDNPVYVILGGIILVLLIGLAVRSARKG